MISMAKGSWTARCDWRWKHGRENQTRFPAIPALLMANQPKRRQNKVISEKKGLLTLYSEIGSRPVMWLWKPYIPLGKVTLLSPHVVKDNQED